MNNRANTWAIVAVVVGSAAGVARAEPLVISATELSVTKARPWAVSGQVTYSMDGPPASTSLGVNVERRLLRHLFIDADVATGLTDSVPTKTGELHFEPKLGVGARARATLPLGARDQHSFFLGAGPRYSTSDGYPDLWQGRIELGYTYRTADGFSLLYAAGADYVLTARAAAVAPSDCISASCPGPLRAGSSTASARFALGYAF